MGRKSMMMGRLAQMKFSLQRELPDEAVARMAVQLSLEDSRQLMLSWLRETDRWTYVDDTRLAALLCFVRNRYMPNSTSPAYYALYQHMKFMVKLVNDNKVFSQFEPYLGEALPEVVELRQYGDIVAEKVMAAAPVNRKYTVRDVNAVPDSCVMSAEELHGEEYDFIEAARRKWEWLKAGNRVRNAANPEGKLPSEVDPRPDDVEFKPGMHAMSRAQVEQAREAGYELADSLLPE